MKLSVRLAAKMRLVRARKRFRELIAEPEQAQLWPRAIEGLRAPALPDPGKRKAIGRALRLAAAASVPALVAAPALAALQPTSVLPTMLGSAVAGRFPGDGTFPLLNEFEQFFNLADGVFAWRAADGTQRRVNLSDLRTPEFYGAVGDGVADDTAAMVAFFAGGKGYVKPRPNGGFYKVTSTLSIPSGGEFIGPQAAVIKLVLPANTPAIPIADTARWSAGGQNICLLGGFTFDHNGAALAPPAGGASYIAVGSALVWRAAYSTISITVRNGWDNGIFVADYDWQGNTYPTDSSMPGVQIHHGFSFGCGAGNHSSISVPQLQGRNGAGINIADAKGFIVSGWYDEGSTCAVGSDTGGTAFGLITNCFAYNTFVDPAYPLNGGGNSFVVQSTGISVVGCIAFNAGRSGFWVPGTIKPQPNLDQSGDATTIAGCYVFFCGTNGMWINASRVSISASHIYAPSRSSAGTYDGFRLEGTFEDIINVTLSGCSATTVSNNQGAPDGYMRFEYAEVAQFAGGIPNQSSGYPFGDSTNHTISATLLGGFNVGHILTLGTTTYVLEGGLSTPNLKSSGPAVLAGTLGLTGLPTSATGLATGQVWRDKSTNPNTLRIV